MTTTETMALPLPVQWSEPMPDWVHEEINAHRDKIPELRKALCVAIASSKGILAKGELNQDQGYKYTGYDSILDAVRLPMAQAGITIEQVSCDIEQELHWANKYGNTTAWKWRAIYLVTHSSGAAVARIVRSLTSPGAKSTGIASASCDRIMITRLMRIAAGGADAQPEREDQDNRGWNHEAGRKPQAQQQRPQQQAPAQQQQRLPAAAPATAAPKPAHKEFTAEDLKAAGLFVDLVVAQIALATHRPRLVVWGRIIRGAAATTPKTEVERAWAAFHAQCAKLELAPNDLSVEIKTKPVLKWSDVSFEPETGEMIDKTDGTLL